MGMELRLSPRLSSIAERIRGACEGRERSAVLYDVGCDHAHVPIRLLKEGCVARAVLMDVAEGPLKKAEENLARFGMADAGNAVLIRSDGLLNCPLPDPDCCNVLLISGMGGALITSILLSASADRPEVLKSFDALVLEPQTEFHLVRRALRALGFVIADEDFVEDEGKYYPVILAKKREGDNSFSGEAEGLMLEAQDRFGPVLLRKKHPVLKRFLTERIGKTDAILRRIPKGETEDLPERQADRRSELVREREILDEAFSVFQGGTGHMKLRELIEKLEQLCPTSFALPWDNSGLQAGHSDKEVRRVMLALDVTSDVVEQAVREGADLILTHHPILFSPLKTVSDADFVGRRVELLIRNDIAAYAMHTNFDVLGMADAAADAVGMIDREVLEVTYEDDVSREGLGRVGHLPEHITLRELAQQVKEAFAVDSVRVYGDPEAWIVTCAILPGSGTDEADKALEAGADVLITGDVTHHRGIDAVEKGIALIDAGHFGVEKMFIPYMEDYFHRELPEIAVLRASQGEPYTVL